MTVKQIPRFLTALLAATLALSACSGAGTETAADDQIVLEVWAQEPWMLPPDGFAAFMEENPNIVVRADEKPEADQLQQMQARKEAGQPIPDLVQDDNFMIEAHQNAGFVAPIDEWKDRWEAEDPESFGNILPAAWDENVVDGETLGVTLLANMEGLFYNVSWFDEAGIDPSTIDSLDALLDAMRTLATVRPDGVALSLSAMPTEGVTSQKAFLVAAGAEFDGAVPNLLSDGGLYVIEWYKLAAEEGLLPEDAIAWSGGEAQGAFLGDRAALIIDGIHAAADFAAEPGFVYGEDWGMFPIPPSMTGAQKDGEYANAPWTWYISTETEHPYEASLLLRYINDNLVEMALAGAGPFQNSEALKDERLIEPWPFWNDTFREAYLESTPTPAGLNGGEVEAVLEELFGEIVSGTDLSARELAEKYQPILDGL